jgi:hypothetical protein
VEFIGPFQNTLLVAGMRGTNLIPKMLRYLFPRLRNNLKCALSHNYVPSVANNLLCLEQSALL